jgi:hypothetical protein
MCFTSILATFSFKTVYQLQHQMAPPHTGKFPQKEGRVALVVTVKKEKQISSGRKTAIAYFMPQTTLHDCLNG